jgi:dnd system-associated protein 4
MTEAMLIREAAETALRRLGRAGTIEEIYAEILKGKLFEFNSPTPEHVLRTTIRRHTGNVERVDTSDLVLFSMVENEVYALNTPIDTKAQRNAGAIGVKRIHRATDKEEIIRLLTSDQLGVFKEIWRLLVFAAQVGFRSDRKERLTATDSGKGIDQSTFGNNPAWPGILYLMALAEKGSAEALGGSAENEEERLAMFQEYANGGLAILRDFFSSRPASLDALIEFIDSQRLSKQGKPDLDLSI